MKSFCNVVWNDNNLLMWMLFFTLHEYNIWCGPRLQETLLALDCWPSGITDKNIWNQIPTVFDQQWFLGIDGKYVVFYKTIVSRRTNHLEQTLSQPLHLSVFSIRGPLNGNFEIGLFVDTCAKDLGATFRSTILWAKKR
jgi:hypothetical protein